MELKNNKYFYSDAQLKNEIERCEYCEDKPCTANCPANCSPADFIRAALVGEVSDYKRAAALIMEANPFGGTCGLVCPEWHCMKGCVKKMFDRSLNIPQIQADIIERADKLGVFPKFEKISPNGKKIAIIGAGPAGLASAAVLARKGYSIEIFEKEKRAGGACNLIPKSRLPQYVLERDINFILSLGDIKINYKTEIKNPTDLLNKNFDAVLIAVGLQKPISLGIKNENLCWYGLSFLKEPSKYDVKNKNVAIIGGGAVATDCAVVCKQKKAKRVIMFALEKLNEMPLSQREKDEIFKYGIEIEGRTRVAEILAEKNKIIGLKTVKVDLKGKKFNLKDIVDIPGSILTRKDIDIVIIAIGAKSDFQKIKHPKIFYAGDFLTGPSTVVEAVASGKNTAEKLSSSLENRNLEYEILNEKKSFVIIKGYKHIPISLETDFFGRKISTPFLLSAAPPSDGYDQMKKAYEAGWSGGIMKTSFDNVPIHIPSEYMFVFNKETYANCDNVSGHQLDRVCKEVEKLIKEYPDRLTMASTGGSVTGNDENDKKVWQSNTKKLENAGCMGIEYSLSCPQGGEGTEGDIVSQNAALTAKIVDWVMEVSNPDIPKLFKLTAAVTSIETIINAIKEVFNKYPNKKAGVTLANTFPTLAFRFIKKKEWEDGVIVGMSGAGVSPISFFTLAKACPLGIVISGNAGPMEYKSAAHFLALGVNTVQFCSIILKYGYNVFNDLCSGLSHLMEYRGIKSMKELIGRALPNPITDFLDLPSEKKISDVNKDLCEHCGNCLRCPYLAISFDENKFPKTDPKKCIGCSLCVQKCFAGALYMRKRTKEELEMLSEK